MRQLGWAGAGGRVAAIGVIATLAMAGEPAVAQAAVQQPLVLERTVPLDDVSGRIDHMAIDLGRSRLVVAELGNGTVEVIDLRTDKIVHRIAGLKSPQGVGYAPKQDVIIVASAGDGIVRLFRAGDFASVGVIRIGDDADNVRIDPRTGRTVVGFGSGGLAILDPATAAMIGRIPLSAHPEGFQLSPSDARIFVNVPDAHEIAVVDTTAGKQVATWKVPGLGSNFPMAIDESSATLATVFRRPPRLVLLNLSSGAAVANLETCGDADDVFFDAKRQRVYVSCGEGSVDVFEHAPAAPRHLAQVQTSSGARTSLFVPELDRLFVAARAGLLGSRASILVLRPEP
jgi:DNA-binding beta-propeller fold protein YncE